MPEVSEHIRYVDLCTIKDRLDIKYFTPLKNLLILKDIIFEKVDIDYLKLYKGKDDYNDVIYYLETKFGVAKRLPDYLFTSEGIFRKLKEKRKILKETLEEGVDFIYIQNDLQRDYWYSKKMGLVENYKVYSNENISELYKDIHNPRGTFAILNNNLVYFEFIDMHITIDKLPELLKEIKEYEEEKRRKKEINNHKNEDEIPF